jgi:hypothetical protein
MFIREIVYLTVYLLGKVTISLTFENVSNANFQNMSQNVAYVLRMCQICFENVSVKADFQNIHIKPDF